MAPDAVVESRAFGAGDQMRQQQQQMLQRQIQQQQLEQQVQQHQLHQHLQRQQQQYQLQQQIHHQWSPQLQPTLYPSYSYPLPSAVSPTLLQSAVSYARPNLAGTSTAPPVHPGVQGGGLSGPPPLSLRDILHILGESVAVLECLRVLLLQLLQWGVEVGALLRASSFLHNLARFFAAAGLSAFSRLKCALFSLPFRFITHKQQLRLQQPHPQEGHGPQPQEREPLLQQAWQLIVSPMTNLTLAAPTRNDMGEHGSHWSPARKQGSALSVFSKTAAAAGTVVATSAAAARRCGGFLKLFPGRLGAVLYGVLVLGVFYRLYLQWKKYRRLLRRYRRLVARVSAHPRKQAEGADEATALLATDLECRITHNSTAYAKEKNEARAWEEVIDRPPEVSTRSDTLETISAADSNYGLQKDASVQTECSSTSVPSSRQQQPLSKTIWLLTDGAKPSSEQQLPKHVERAGTDYACSSSTAAPPWTPPAATPSPFLTASTPASFPRDKKGLPAASANFCQPPTSTAKLLTTAPFTPSMGETDFCFPAPPQEGSSASLSYTVDLEKTVEAAPPLAPAAGAQPSVKIATSQPPPVVADSAVRLSRSRDALAEIQSPAREAESAVHSVERVAAAANNTWSEPAANEVQKEGSECTPQRSRGGSGELLLHQFLQARAYRLKDSCEAGFLVTSLEKYAAACGAAENTVLAEIATGEERTATVAREPRRDTRERTPVHKDGEEAEEEHPGRGLGAATSAKSERPLQAAVARIGDGCTFAGDLSKATPAHFRHRAASWADGFTPQASTRLIDASRKALAALAAARKSRSENQVRADGSVVENSVDTKARFSSDTCKCVPAAALAKDAFPSNPLPYSASDNPATPAARAGTPGAPAATAAEGSGQTRSHSESEHPTGSFVSSARLVVGDAALPRVPTINTDAAAAATDSIAVDGSQAAVKDLVEEQLRCYKAAEKRTTPAFRENPFLRLSRVQREKEQQEKYRQQLLEREFARTDIPPWERGSHLETTEGEQRLGTSYWKTSDICQPAAPTRATSWSATSSLLVPAECTELPQTFLASNKLQQNEPERPVTQRHAESQRTLQQPEKKDTVLQQQQEKWLPAYLSYPPNDAAMLREPEPPSTPPSLPAPVRSPTLPNAQSNVRETDSHLHAQKGMMRPSTPAGPRAYPVAGAALATGISETWHHDENMPYHTGRASGPRARSTRRASCAQGAHRRSAVREKDAIEEERDAAGLAATDAQAGVWPTAARATPKQGVPSVHRGRAPMAQRNRLINDKLDAAEDGQNSTSRRFHGAVVSSRARRRKQNFVGHGDTGTSEPVGLLEERIVAPASDTATRFSNHDTRGPLAPQASAFAGTALAVRRQQQQQLRQKLRTRSIHQQAQEQPQQLRTEQKMQFQANRAARPVPEQQENKDTVNNRTPSTASDAGWLAELAATARRESHPRRYYCPELYV